MEEYFADELKAFYCSVCKLVIPVKTRVALQKHFADFHRIPDLSERPDVHDPKLYCRSCKTTSSSKEVFREHMKHIHFLNPDLEYKRLDPSLLPDLKDKNFYCRVCKKSNKSERLYNRHLLLVHGIEVSVRPDLFCAKCNKYMSTTQTLRAHIKRKHSNDSGDDTSENEESDSQEEDETATNDISTEKIPEESESETEKETEKETEEETEDEPSRKRKMEEQLIARKKLGLSIILQPPSIPDAYPIKDYCDVCKISFRNRGNVNKHMASLHKDVFTVIPATRDNLPDPYNEYFYCSICNQKATSKKAFHHHLRAYHLLGFNDE